MLEYLSYRKFKKNQEKKRAAQQQSPILADEDENFLKPIVAEGPAPPLPERTYLLDPETGNPDGKDEASEKGKGKQIEDGHNKGMTKHKSNGKTNRLSFVQRMISKKVCDPPQLLSI